MRLSLQPLKGFENQQSIHRKDCGNQPNRKNTAVNYRTVKTQKQKEVEARKGVHSSANSQKYKYKYTKITRKPHTDSMRQFLLNIIRTLYATAEMRFFSLPGKEKLRRNKLGEESADLRRGAYIDVRVVPKAQPYPSETQD